MSHYIPRCVSVKRLQEYVGDRAGALYLQMRKGIEEGDTTAEKYISTIENETGVCFQEISSPYGALYCYILESGSPYQETLLFDCVDFKWKISTWFRVYQKHCTTGNCV